MKNQVTSKRETQSIPNSEAKSNLVPVTPQMEDLLIRMHNAIVQMPSTETIIKTFNLKTTKQAVSQKAIKRRTE